MSPYYADEHVTLYHGDCVDILPTLDPVDLVLTDPPYGVTYLSNWGVGQGNRPISNDGARLSLALYRSVLPRLRAQHVLWFTRWDAWPDVWALLGQHYPLRGLLVWDKGSPGMGDLKHWGPSYELIASAGTGSCVGSRDQSILRYNAPSPRNRIRRTAGATGVTSHQNIPSGRPRALDLFCCAGGMGRGLHDAGFDVVGVDIDPQPNYPYEFHQGDALEFLARHGQEFDYIHGSPPCQGYLNLGAVNRALGRTYEHPDLISATRWLMVMTGKPYTIENVADAKAELHDPVRVCGTSFGLPLRRHRLFESNLPILGTDCQHHRFTEKRYWTGWSPGGKRTLSTVVQVYGNAGGREEWPAAMGIDWMTAREMCEAIPPAYGEHIGRQIHAHLIERSAAA